MYHNSKHHSCFRSLNVNLNHTSNDSWQGAGEKYALAINGNLNYFAYRKWDKNLWYPYPLKISFCYKVLIRAPMRQRVKS